MNSGKIKSGVGIKCRVHDGSVLGAASIPVLASLGLEEAEALALLEGIKFARETLALVRSKLILTRRRYLVW